MRQRRSCGCRPDRNTPKLALESDETCQGRGDADRPASIGPQSERSHARRNGCGRSRARAARVLATFQGLRVIPVKGLSPTGLQPYSPVVVFPMMTAPAALSLSTEGASSGATLPPFAQEPKA